MERVDGFVSVSKMVSSDSAADVVPAIELAFEVELLVVVTNELPELDKHAFGRCLTELFGLIVLRPLNFIACNKITNECEHKYHLISK